MNYGGFSIRRFVGIPALLSTLSRRIGIPLTKSCRQHKLGALLFPILGF
jgi:hypothetical protein